MSRITEALRRAAGETVPDATPAGEVTPEPVAGADVTALASEPFPVEISERIRTRASTAPATSRVTETPASIPSADPTSTPQPHNGKIFERMDPKFAEKVVADSQMIPLSREQYRRLAAVLHDAQMNSGLRVIMIASAVAGEGKTLTATNLALTLSESYQNRVLLVDADLRKPTLHQVFQLEMASGLVEGLAAKTETKLVVRQVSERLSILPAGRPTSDPMAALTSTRMRRFIDEAKESFDWVILDTPPLMLLPDAHLLSALVDGAVLVIKANSTAHEQIKRATDIIGKERIAGVVLNRAEAGAGAGYGHGYYERYYLAHPADRGR